MVSSLELIKVGWFCTSMLLVKEREHCESTESCSLRRDPGFHRCMRMRTGAIFGVGAAVAQQPGERRDQVEQDLLDPARRLGKVQHILILQGEDGGLQQVGHSLVIRLAVLRQPEQVYNHL